MEGMKASFYQYYLELYALTRAGLTNFNPQEGRIILNNCPERRICVHIHRKVGYSLN